MVCFAPGCLGLSDYWSGPLAGLYIGGGGVVGGHAERHDSGVDLSEPPPPHSGGSSCRSSPCDGGAGRQVATMMRCWQHRVS